MKLIIYYKCGTTEIIFVDKIEFSNGYLRYYSGRYLNKFTDILFSLIDSFEMDNSL